MTQTDPAPSPAPGRTRELMTLAAIAAGATLAALALTLAGSPVFAGILGPLPPVPVTLGAGLLGALALAWLRHPRRLGPAPRPPGRRGALWLALGASAFAALTIASDIAAPYPADINAALPQALLFYPAIGLVAEAAFHLLPLALVFALAAAARLPARIVLAIGFVTAAATEPAFQVAFGWGSGPAWRDIFMAVQLFAFALVELTVLRRHGFGPMFAFRMVYYLHWHVLWNILRQSLLF